MRVLFLTKQQYMAKDLIQDRFGRYYEFPRALARLGHQVRGVCLKYRTDYRAVSFSDKSTQVEWSAFPLGRNWPLGFVKHYRRLQQIAAAFKPEVVVGASDAAHVVMAASLAKKFAIPYAVDLYDNLESYGVTQIFGVKQLLRRAVRTAPAVSVVSETLREKIENEYRPRGTVRTITNAIAPEIFHPTDKIAARRRLGLPETVTLIGTGGALNRARGIDTLFQAFDKLSGSKKDWSLVLAGPIDHRLALPAGSKIIYLGELPHQRVGDLFNALDVGVICNRDDAFGRYCFPQKLFEMLACGLPVVAADVGALRRVLPGAERYLFDPDSGSSLADAILAQIRTQSLPSVAIPTWNDCGQQLENLLKTALVARVRSHGKVDAVPLRAGEL